MFIEGCDALLNGSLAHVTVQRAWGPKDSCKSATFLRRWKAKCRVCGTMMLHIDMEKVVGRDFNELVLGCRVEH